MGEHGVPRMGEHGIPRKGEHGVPRMGEHGVPRMGEHGVPMMGEHGVPRRVSTERTADSGGYRRGCMVTSARSLSFTISKTLSRIFVESRSHDSFGGRVQDG